MYNHDCGGSAIEYIDKCTIMICGGSAIGYIDKCTIMIVVVVL